MLLTSAGLSPRRFAGRDLIALIKSKRRGDGSIAGYVSYSAFGILALRAAKERAPAATVSYLLRAQHDDGGFGVAASSPSDTDMTGAVMQALAAGGRLGGVPGRKVRGAGGAAVGRPLGAALGRAVGHALRGPVGHALRPALGRGP